MSRQFQFYLLPSDIEWLLAELRSRFDAKLIAASSDRMQPTELDIPFKRSENRTSYVDCFLVKCCDAEVSTFYVEARKEWAIDLSSEVIQISGCHFDAEVLQIGRFYFQTDRVIGNDLCPKRDEFLKWAGRVFAWTKRNLQWSRPMVAYIGREALTWRSSGGRFAELRRADGTYMFAPDDFSKSTKS